MCGEKYDKIEKKHFLLVRLLIIILTINKLVAMDLLGLIILKFFNSKIV